MPSRGFNRHLIKRSNRLEVLFNDMIFRAIGMAQFIINLFVVLYYKVCLYYSCCTAAHLRSVIPRKYTFKTTPPEKLGSFDQNTVVQRVSNLSQKHPSTSSFFLVCPFQVSCIQFNSCNKGQLISKGFLGVLEFFQKMKKQISFLDCRAKKTEFVHSFFGRIVA